MRLGNKIRFKEDDPLRYLHVPRSQRVDVDEGGESDALDAASGFDDQFDRDEIRNRGGVVPPEDLQ